MTLGIPLTRIDWMVNDPSRLALAARLEDLLTRHRALLRQAISSLNIQNFGLDVNDIEQEIRIRIWQVLKDERPIHNVPSYLWRVALTTTIDAIRQAQARRENPMKSETPPLGGFRGSSPANSPEGRALFREIVSRVEEILQVFPPEKRRAVGLYLQGFGSGEVAELLGWSEPKARNLIYRGLQVLRQRLERQGIKYEFDE